MLTLRARLAAAPPVKLVCCQYIGFADMRAFSTQYVGTNRLRHSPTLKLGVFAKLFSPAGFRLTLSCQKEKKEKFRWSSGWGTHPEIPDTLVGYQVVGYGRGVRGIPPCNTQVPGYGLSHTPGHLWCVGQKLPSKFPGTSVMALPSQLFTANENSCEKTIFRTSIPTTKSDRPMFTPYFLLWCS